MIKLWSELPAARSKEQVADVATILWVAFSGSIVWQLFQFLAGFAEAGRMVTAGGQTMIVSGQNLGSRWPACRSSDPRLATSPATRFRVPADRFPISERSLNSSSS